MPHSRSLSAAAALFALARASATAALTVDVLVYSANPAGIGAAIAAADGGRNQVLLMEPLDMIGGMGAAGGVGLMNQGCGDAGISGLGRQWGMLNGAYYDPQNPALNLFPGLNVAARSFWLLLNGTSGITTRTGCRLVSVDRGAACLTGAAFLCAGDTEPVSVAASIFIDASYDGDVVAAAGGISYTSGREPRGAYNESLAGVSLLDDPNESFDKQGLAIDARGPDGALLPGISADPMPPAGTGDDRLMAFSYFPCVTDDPANSIPYPRPAGYDPAHFLLLQRTIDGVVANGRYPLGPDLSYFSEWHAYSDPTVRANCSKLLLCCGQGPVNCDEPDLNRGWARANHSARQAMAAAHRYYLLGSLYYMANEAQVPNYTRYAVGRWGLCADEYAAAGNWPPQIYVRVSNRLVGDYVLTQNNIAAPRSKPDGVSMACWEFDAHTTSRRAVPDPGNASRTIARNEGYFRNDLAAPHLPCAHLAARCTGAEANWYDVPFAVMLPARGEAANLLVPVAISATSVAYSSARIEGMFMDLGTAAGVAAALALQQQVALGGGHGLASGACPVAPLQDTNVTAVQSVLISRYAQRVHGPVGTSLEGR